MIQGSHYSLAIITRLRESALLTPLNVSQGMIYYYMINLLILFRGILSQNNIVLMMRV